MLRLVMLVALVLLAGCAKPLKTRDLQEPPPMSSGHAMLPEPTYAAVRPIVEDLVANARQHNTQYFALFVDKPYASVTGELMQRIGEVDMLRTYRFHLVQDDMPGAPPDGLRLDYHLPAHFQIDLRKNDSGRYEVTRIWPCR